MEGDADAVDLLPARITAEGAATIAATRDGEREVVTQRAAARARRSGLDRPTIGDWLAVEPLPASPGRVALRTVMPRRGRIVRIRPADGEPQVLAANVDVAFVVAGLDHDLDLRRIERFLAIIREGAVEPVVVLNKADIADDPSGHLGRVRAVAGDAPVVVSSATGGTGLEAIRSLIGPGRTACLLGSSGVGKSSLTNALLGSDRQAVRDLRADDSKGRHTTVRRDLFVLPGDAGCLIDTPGLRTVGLTEGSSGLEATFEDVTAFAAACRFRDCGHAGEPGCAVEAAVAAGRLDGARVEHHRRLEAERATAAVRADLRARRAADRHIGRVYRRAGRQGQAAKRGDPLR